MHLFLLTADWQDPSFWDNSNSYNLTTDLPTDRKLQPHNQEVHYIATDQSSNSVVCTVKVITNGQLSSLTPPHLSVNVMIVLVSYYLRLTIQITFICS